MNRRLFVAILGAVARIAKAEGSPLFTGGRPNGRAWKSMGTHNIYYMGGLREGAITFSATVGMLKEVSRESVTAANSILLTDKFTTGELVAETTRLFDLNAGNSIIPVADVYMTAISSLSGKSREETEKDGQK